MVTIDKDSVLEQKWYQQQGPLSQFLVYHQKRRIEGVNPKLVIIGVNEFTLELVEKVNPVLAEDIEHLIAPPSNAPSRRPR